MPAVVQHPGTYMYHSYNITYFTKTQQFLAKVYKIYGAHRDFYSAVRSVCHAVIELYPTTKFRRKTIMSNTNAQITAEEPRFSYYCD